MSNQSMKRFPGPSSLTATLCLAVAGVFTTIEALAAELTWVGDFETGDYSQYKPHLLGEGFRSNKQIVQAPVRGGNFATELVIENVEYEGSVKERAELMSNLNQKIIRFYWDGPEYWVGFSFFFQEWNADAWTFFQIHAPNEPKGDECDYAGNALTLRGTGAADKYGVDDTISLYVLEKGGISNGTGAGSNNSKVADNPLTTGVWHDYVMNFKLSSKGDGFFKVWKDGQVIYSASGLTNVNHMDSCGEPIVDQRWHNGVHIGLYTDDSPQYRRIFYDEVRVAEGMDGYALVAPTGEHQTSAPKKKPLPPLLTSAD